MAWDFSTEPQFQKKLDWIDDFVRTEVLPLETLDLDWLALQHAIAPLKEQVKQQELWAAHLDAELGGQGYGQVKLGLMHEIIGRSWIAPLVFGNQAPDSGNSEILAAAGTPAQKNRWLQPLLAGEMYSAFAMTERDNAGTHVGHRLRGLG
jgi:acyl-CoA dehydrogenase